MYTYRLNVEETLAEFDIAGVPPRPNPQCVLNEINPQGLPDRIIKNNQPWNVGFHWRVSGHTSDAIGPCDWKLNVYLLKLNAPGGANVVATKSVPYKVTEGQDDYDETIEIHAGEVPDGMYKLYTSVDVENPGPAQPIIPVTLFGEGPVMKFYTP